MSKKSSLKNTHKKSAPKKEKQADAPWVSRPFEKIGNPPESELIYPDAPWREGSYSQKEGKFYPELSEMPSYVKKIKENFPDQFLAFRGYRGDPVVLLKREKILEVLKFLRDDPESAFDLMRDIFAVDDLRTDSRIKEFADLGVKKTRFEIIYNLYSLRYRHELRLRVSLPEDDFSIDSAIRLYKCANWHERETWDMYGIQFNGHPDLTRLLNHDKFEGHPLRKDYPINRRHNIRKPTEL